MSQGVEPVVHHAFLASHRRGDTLRSVSQNNPWPTITMKNSILLFSLSLLIMTSCSKDDDTSPSSTTPLTDPVALRLDSITVDGFGAQNDAGSYWDGGDGSNKPDIYIEVRKNGILVFTSSPVNGASPTGTHNMNAAQMGVLPISFNETDDFKVDLYDNDGDPAVNAPDFIGRVTINNILPFFYGGDHAAGFSNVEVSGTRDITLKLTGTFIY
jgi:hypothetical protein